MRLCRRCKVRDLNAEPLNHKTICFDCQRRSNKAKYKRIYAKRKAREAGQ